LSEFITKEKARAMDAKPTGKVAVGGSRTKFKSNYTQKIRLVKRNKKFLPEPDFINKIKS
jgi:hypothetical protein